MAYAANITLLCNGKPNYKRHVGAAHLIVGSLDQHK